MYDNPAIPDTLEKAAALAMLTVDGGERARLESDIADILSFADALSQASQEPPKACDMPDNAPLREDAITKGLTTEEALANAPETRGDYVTLPRTVG